jgi:hypothetical protein
MTFRAARSSLLGMTALVTSCGASTDVVFLPLTLQFESVESRSSEDVTETRLTLVLSAASQTTVTFEVVAEDGAASGHDECGSRDYSLGLGSIEIAPGETTASVALRHLNDDLPEIDEDVSLRISRVRGAVVGQLSRHTHEILDDDRSALLDVRADFGARGDGSTDDTEPIAEAIRRAGLSPGSVVFFPPGTYVTRTIELISEASYYGYGATLTRPADQPRDQKCLSLRYSRATDSAPVVIQGFALDGNRDNQSGPYSAWEYRNADLLDVAADPAQPGRLRLIAEDLSFASSGASGLRLGPNTDSVVCYVSGDEVFTDLVQLRGGNSRLSGRRITASGTSGTTGLVFSVVDEGYGESRSVEVELSDVTLESGDLQLNLRAGSTFFARRLHVNRAPFLVRAPHSQVRFEDSLFTSGPAVFDLNRVVAPTDVSFVRTTFVISESAELTITTPEENRELYGLNVIWNDSELAYDDTVDDVVLEAIDDQRLELRDCAFSVGTDVEASDQVFGIGTSSIDTEDPELAMPGANNVVVVESAKLGDGVRDVFAPTCAGCQPAP